MSRDSGYDEGFQAGSHAAQLQMVRVVLLLLLYAAVAGAYYLWTQRSRTQGLSDRVLHLETRSVLTEPPVPLWYEGPRRRPARAAKAQVAEKADPVAPIG